VSTLQPCRPRRFLGARIDLDERRLAPLAPDLDPATTLWPVGVMERRSAAGIKAVPTGIEHGTVTAVSSGTVVEVTTLRCDVSTDGRRATVAFTDDWQADASRRDFTINALYADPFTGEVHDYFGGHDDLKARTVRFIGEPLQRIAEDHLRILRYFRFHARYGHGEPNAEALDDRCPNCGGELTDRPTRAAKLHDKYPPSAVRKHVGISGGG